MIQHEIVIIDGDDDIGAVSPPKESYWRKRVLGRARRPTGESVTERSYNGNSNWYKFRASGQEEEESFAIVLEIKY
ncbi:MAG: hypothetical protein ACK6DZ_11985 [Acidobacteriota bacterium]